MIAGFTDMLSCYKEGSSGYNLADQTRYKIICGSIGQAQPAGGVIVINSEDTRFSTIEELISYINIINNSAME